MEKIAARKREPGVKSYKGFVVEAVLKDESLSPSNRESLIKLLPGQIEYDEYVGMIAILNSDESSFNKESKTKLLFSHKEKIAIGISRGRPTR